MSDELKSHTISQAQIDLMREAIRRGDGTYAIDSAAGTMTRIHLWPKHLRRAPAPMGRAPLSRHSSSRPRESRRRAGPRTGAARGDPDEPSPPPPPRTCEVCGGSLARRRSHAQTCSSRCRVAKHRRANAGLTAADRAAIERRYEAALGIVRSLALEERHLLLAAVVWPSDSRLAPSRLREAA
jgi:5-methylcytosine-specific restriction endonuclease McrA